MKMNDPRTVRSKADVPHDSQGAQAPRPDRKTRLLDLHPAATLEEMETTGFQSSESQTMVEVNPAFLMAGLILMAGF